MVHSKKTLLFLVIFAPLLLCCNKSGYDLTNIYLGNKMVIYGFVSSDSGCIVRISKTIPSTGNIPFDQLKVKDARVFLYENGDSILELKGDTSAKFTTQNFKPKFGAKYKIKATSFSLPECQSDEEIFENLLISDKFSTEFSKNVSLGYSGIIFSFELNFDTSKLNYFTFSSIGDGKDGYGAIILKPSGLNKSCGLIYSGTGEFISSNCLLSNETIKIGATWDENSNFPKPKIIILNVSSISPIFYKYLASINDILKVDFAFIEPNTAVSNINGGYGIFYCKSTKSYTYKF